MNKISPKAEVLKLILSSVIAFSRKTVCRNLSLGLHHGFSWDKVQIVPNLCSYEPKSCNFKVFMYCKMADFYHVTSRFRERISTMKSPLLAVRRRILHLSVQGHSYFCIICLLFLLFIFFFFVLFFHARENYTTRKKRDGTLFSASCLSVVSSSAASPSP